MNLGGGGDIFMKTFKNRENRQQILPPQLFFQFALQQIVINFSRLKMHFKLLDTY